MMVVAKKKAASKKKAVKKDARKNKVEKFNQQLKCKLTTDEKLVIAETLADKYAEVARLEDEKSDYNTSQKAKIKTAQSQAEEASDQFRTGHEFRRIDCTRTLDWRKGTVVEVRLDTKEKLVSRKMTEEECQIEMNFDTPASEAGNE